MCLCCTQWESWHQDNCLGSKKTHVSLTAQQVKREKWPPVQVDKNSQAWRSSTTTESKPRQIISDLRYGSIPSAAAETTSCCNPSLTSSNISPIQMVMFPFTFLLPQGTSLPGLKHTKDPLRSDQTNFPKADCSWLPLIMYGTVIGSQTVQTKAWDKNSCTSCILKDMVSYGCLLRST